MESKKPTIFLTGATGLIGSYLLKILLENNHKIYVLARSKKDKTAKDRVVDILNFWDKQILADHSDNLTVLEGDITSPDLGLDKTSQDILKNEVEEVYHSAASVSFNLPFEKISKINVDGAKNLLKTLFEWQQFGKLKKVNHLSTTYVCGDYEGNFREENLELGQGFRTAYEKSKFEAERVVNEYRKKGLWMDVFRIPVVGAESSTGKTPVIQAFSQMLRLWCSELFSVFPGKELELHYIPVDFLSQAIVCIASHTKIKNQNYHPFGAQQTPLSIVLDAASDFLEFKKPRLVRFDELGSFDLTPSQKMILEVNISFLNRKVSFDSRKTIAVLKENNFEFPEIDKNVLLATLAYFKDVLK